MGMFERPSNSPPSVTPGPPGPPPQFPELIEYEVKTGGGEWLKVIGHNAQVDDRGSLLIHRGIFVNEECTQVSAVPAGFFAMGEWRQVKTAHEGFKRESPLAL